jgi:hypothetical protein
LTDHPLFQFVADGRNARDVPSLMDTLGRQVDIARPAVFVLSNWMSGAAAAIQRCYPGAARYHAASGDRRDPILAFGITTDGLAAGRGCSAPGSGPGLLARHFRGANWDDEIVQQRVEDWPFRYEHDVTSYKSVAWSGWLVAPVRGTYQFQLLTDTAYGEAHVAHLRVRGGEQGRTRLEAGRHPVVIRCRPERREAGCWLRWAPPGAGFRAIPTQFLSPD